jgi:GTPase SAR1 family protein
MSGKFDEDLSLATHKKHTIKFKIVFIGDQAVGKSSIINRFIKDEFDSTHNVSLQRYSQQLASISSRKMSISMTEQSVCNCGIPQASKDSKVSFQDISEIPMLFF